MNITRKYNTRHFALNLENKTVLSCLTHIGIIIKSNLHIFSRKTNHIVHRISGQSNLILSFRISDNLGLNNYSGFEIKRIPFPFPVFVIPKNHTVWIISSGHDNISSFFILGQCASILNWDGTNYLFTGLVMSRIAFNHGTSFNSVLCKVYFGSTVFDYFIVVHESDTLYPTMMFVSPI